MCASFVQFFQNKIPSVPSLIDHFTSCHQLQLNFSDVDVQLFKEHLFWRAQKLVNAAKHPRYTIHIQTTLVCMQPNCCVPIGTVRASHARWLRNYSSSTVSECSPGEDKRRRRQEAARSPSMLLSCVCGRSRTPSSASILQHNMGLVRQNLFHDDLWTTVRRVQSAPLSFENSSDERESKTISCIERFEMIIGLEYEEFLTTKEQLVL